MSLIGIKPSILWQCLAKFSLSPVYGDGLFDASPGILKCVPWYLPTSQQWLPCALLVDSIARLDPPPNVFYTRRQPYVFVFPLEGSNASLGSRVALRVFGCHETFDALSEGGTSALKNHQKNPWISSIVI